MDRDSGVLCIVTIVHFQLQLIQSASDDYIDIVANHAWFVFNIWYQYLYMCEYFMRGIKNIWVNWLLPLQSMRVLH
jgi:hypothetical protein